MMSANVFYCYHCQESIKCLLGVLHFFLSFFFFDKICFLPSCLHFISEVSFLVGEIMNI